MHDLELIAYRLLFLDKAVKNGLDVKDYEDDSIIKTVLNNNGGIVYHYVQSHNKTDSINDFGIHLILDKRCPIFVQGKSLSAYTKEELILTLKGMEVKKQKTND